jgi:hypothetical protein
MARGSADRAAKGKAGAIEETLRLLGRRGGAARERDLKQQGINALIFGRV